MANPPKPLTAASAVLLVLVHFGAFMAVLVLGSLASDGETVSVPFRVGALLIAPLVALYVGLIRHAPAEGTLAAVRLTRPEGRQWPLVLLALVCGAALAPLIALIYAWMMKLVPVDDGEAPEALAMSALVLLAAAQIVSAGVLEALFRGLIQPRLSTVLGPRRGLWVTVLVFVVAQVTALTIPVAAVMGAVAGIVVAASGTTWASILAQVAMQVCLIFMPAEPAIWMVVTGTAVAGVALAAIWRLRL